MLVYQRVDVSFLDFPMYLTCTQPSHLTVDLCVFCERFFLHQSDALSNLEGRGTSEVVGTVGAAYLDSMWKIWVFPKMKVPPNHEFE